MNTKIFGLFAVIILLIASGCNKTPKLTEKEQTLEILRIANKYFMDTHKNPGEEIVTNRARPSNIWTRAVYYEGLMALYQIDPKPEYYDYTVEWGKFHDWGLRGGDTYTRNADNHCCGQAYLDLYLIDKKSERIKNIKASIDSILNTTRIDDWWWIDALQMAMPIFARLGEMYNDTAYHERMYDMYMFTKESHGDSGLYNTRDKLWWRDKDYVAPYKEPNGEDCYWSRGNGWVLAALARVMEIMPKDAPHYNEYLKTFKEMAEALIPIQREDGFWNVSLHDPTNYGGKETTGTSLFVYGMAWGINNGVLDKEKYEPVVMKAWNAMVKDAVHKNGFLGYVQGTGKDPSAGQPVTYEKVPNHDDYGVGCFLLGGSEVYKMIEEPEITAEN